jgi:hypothetical protein
MEEGTVDGFYRTYTSSCDICRIKRVRRDRPRAQLMPTEQSRIVADRFRIIPASSFRFARRRNRLGGRQCGMKEGLVLVCGRIRAFAVEKGDADRMDTERREEGTVRAWSGSILGN